MDHHNPGDPPLLYRLENAEKTRAVELEARADVELEFCPGMVLEQSLLLPFQALFLTVGGDASIQEGFSDLALAHETVDLGLGDAPPAAIGAHRAEPTAAIP